MDPPLAFRAVFRPAAAARPPQGDKILLPPSALQSLLDAASQAGLDVLPQPLTFRLANMATGQAVYAGIREFSAAEGDVVLSAYLRGALGMADGTTDGMTDGTTGSGKTNADQTPLAISLAALPKGTFVRLRPLEHGYDPADWRALLERQLREAYTTLTTGALLTVRGRTAAEVFRLRVDDVQPPGDGICVVDTDLEVDIEAFKGDDGDVHMDATPSAHPADSGTSQGGELSLFKPVQGHVRPGDSVDYTLPAWDHARPLQIVLSGLNDGTDDDAEPGLAVDLLVSPQSAHQRMRPRESEYVWANFGLADSAGTKMLTIAPTSAELDGAEALLVSVHGWAADGIGTSVAHPFVLHARVVLEEEAASADPSAKTKNTTESTESTENASEDTPCPNCHQLVPRRTLLLHESFCRRNNAVCAQCGQVFQARSAAWQNHWHCAIDPTDGGAGQTAVSRAKHDSIFHTPHACPADTCVATVASFPSLPALARHRTTTCPAKLILCQFCHLEVPQEGDPSDPAAEAATALTGMTPHERADGARTTECYMCDAIVRMRDMRAHLQHHALDRQNRPPPPLCRNAACGRTRFGVGPKGQVKAAAASANTNPLGLCATCFAPLYVSAHDPEGRALRRRIERRYLSQLLTGCGRSWCANGWCRTGRQNQHMGAFGSDGSSTAAAAATPSTAVLLPLVKPLVVDATSGLDDARPMHFCVDETTQQRAAVADLLADRGRYVLPWCVAACEAEGPDPTRAWEWLLSWAPVKGTEE